MANTIKIKAGNGIPTTSDIVDKELAFDRDANKLYINDSGTIVDLSGSASLDTEAVQDIVGAMFSGNTETRITATYQDSDGTIDLVVDDLDTDTQLTTENVQDIVGAMFSSNTETRISATYQDGDGTIDLVVDDMTTDTNTNQLTTFTLTADSGSNQTIAHGNTLDIAGGTGISTSVGATDTVTVNLDNHSGDLITSGTVAAARIANLAASKITSGTFDDARIAASSITQHTDSKYLRSDTGDTAAGNITFTAKLLGDTNTTAILNGATVTNVDTGFTNDIGTGKASGLQPFRYSNTSTNTPLGGSGSMANNANWGLSLYSHGTGGSGNYGLQMSGGDNDNQLFFIRRVSNGSFGSWFEMWHSGNDGSGSGLDADTLDGSHASAFLTSVPNHSADLLTSGTVDAARLPTIDISSKTNLSAGTNISLSGDTLNVDDAFLKNNADDTTSGTVTGAGFNASNYFQIDKSGTTGSFLKIVNSGWSNATTHDIIYNSYLSNLGDFTYLKSAGNSTSGHGIAMVADNVFAVGDTTVETGNPNNNDAADPFTDTWFTVDGSGNGVFKGSVTATSLDISGDIDVDGTTNLDALDVDGASDLTGRVTITDGGADGLLINNDTGNSADSARIFFEGTSTSVIMQQGNDLSFRTGGTTGSSSGTERVSINTTGMRIHSGSLGVAVAGSSTDGRIDASNDVVAFSTSDKRLKENIKPLDNALDKVLKISGVSFDWKSLTKKEKKTIHGNQGHDVGVIAQEIEEVLPEVVTTRDSGYKAVKYEKIVPLLIESIKELKAEIEELKK